MRATLTSLVIAIALAGCGYVSDYEASVYDEEPVYCYQSIGGVSCFETPHHRDQRRLVNFYGPAPERYTPPDPPPAARLDPPPAVNYFVRDAEPVPRPRPHGNVDDRPWLAPTADNGTTAASDVPEMDSIVPAAKSSEPVASDPVFIDGT